MRNSKRYENYKDLWFKILSNLVSEKTWIFAIASIALFTGLIGQTVWVSIVGAVYGMGKVIKWQWIKSMVTPEIEENSEEMGEDCSV